MSRRRGRGYGVGWGDEHLSSLFQLPAHSGIQVSLSFSHEDSGPRVAFCQTDCGPHCAFIAFAHTVPTSFVSFPFW